KSVALARVTLRSAARGEPAVAGAVGKEALPSAAMAAELSARNAALLRRSNRTQDRSKIRPAFSLSGAFSVGGWSGGRAPTSSGVNTTGAPSSPGVVPADALAESLSASPGGIVAF